MAPLSESGEWDADLWFERRRTALLLTTGVASLLAMALFVLLPLRIETNRIQRGIDRVESDLEAARADVRPRAHPYRRRPDPREDEEPERQPAVGQPGELEATLRREQRRHERLLAEWHELKDLAATFRKATALERVLGAPEEGRIDFKVSLFNARMRIADAAGRTGMLFPADLGIPETLGATESAEVRLWQLAASVRFLELCIEVGIPAVLEIQARPPLTLPSLLADAPTQTDYPLRVRFQTDYPRFVEWIGRVSQPGEFFGLRAVQIAKSRPGGESPVEVTATLHATVFRQPAPRDEPAPMEDPDS